MNGYQLQQAENHARITAKKKRQRRAQRNLKNKANGGFPRKERPK